MCLKSSHYSLKVVTMDSKLLLIVGFALMTILTIGAHGDPVELELEDEDIKDDDFWTRVEPGSRAERLQTLMNKLHRRLAFTISNFRRRTLMSKIEHLQQLLNKARDIIRDRLGSNIVVTRDGTE